MERFGTFSAILQIKKVVRIGAFFSCAFLFILLTLMVAPVSYKNDPASATTGVAKQSATTITLSTTNNQATVDLDINNPNGVFAKSDAEGTAEFGIVTNNAAGYILSIAASDDDGKLTNGDYNVPVSIASLEQAVTENVFDTSANNNKWGFKPNKYVDTNDEIVENTGENAKYLPAPTTTATVLDITDTSNTEPNDYSIELGVRADYATPAGTYTNTFNLTATGNPTPYVIAYDENTEDAVTNMPLSTAAAASEERVTISSDIPSRSGYQFIGWCTVEPEENEGGADSCEGEDANIVLAGGEIGIDRTSETNVTTLYALWQSDSIWGTSSVDNKHYIQDVTDATCPSVPTVVYDKRDNKPYYIQKIKTGNNEYCWMTTNLDIAGGTVLDSTTSNIADGTTYTLPQSRVENFAPSSSGESMAGVYNSNNTVCGDRPCYSYYNYLAATAGTNPDYNNSTYDICPKGWQLPSAQVFEDLRSTYSSAGLLTNAPWNGADSGYFPSNVIQSWAGRTSDVFSNYWSSTAFIYSNTLAYILSYSISSSDNTNSVYSTPKVFGMAVRCVAKKPFTSRYIQDVTASTCPDERTLVYDKRDEKPYYIQKLVSDYADLCWMTSDLELAGGTVLDSSTSNIKEGTTYTLPESSSEEFTTTEARVYNTGVTDCDGTRPCHSYYNLVAVSAGALDPSNWGDNVDYGNTANIDICPKGWSLPSDRDTNALYHLLKTHLNNEALNTSPFYANQSKEYSTMVAFENTLVLASYPSKYYWRNVNGDTRITTTDYGFYGNASDDSVSFGTGSTSDLTGPTKDGQAVRCVAKYDNSTTKTYIQDISKDTCPTTPTIVYDKRDGEKYTIQKLADGNCWLLDNLRLNKSTLSIALTNENTNIKSTTTFELPGNTKRNYGSVSEPQINASSRIKTASYGAGEGQIGSYYNYCAASAGTICGDEVSSDATEDICPAGWRMPTGGDNGEYQTLINSYSTFEDAKNALRSPVSGYYYGNSKHHQGSYGSFWSSTYDNNNHFYSLDVRLDSVYPDYNSNRDSGLSVRCVAKERLYIQDINKESCPVIPTLVYDKRDDETYYIQKMMDGNCWMLDNLRLDAATLKTTLTPENTNMSPEVSFTLPSSSTSGFTTNTVAKVNSSYKNTSMSYGLGTTKNGSYYNYCAASAGTICSSSNTKDAVFDICPAGWHLPTGGAGGAGGELEALYNAYGNNVSVFKNAFHAALTGYYYNKSAGGRSSYAFILTSTHGNNTSTMQNLRIGTSDVVLPTSMSHYRYYGASIRCVAYEPVETYIQDVTPDTCSAEPTLVYDKRDLEKYTIQKLDDGRCWLLDNLRLGSKSLRESISSENTNISPEMSFNFTTAGSAIGISNSNTELSYGDGTGKIGVKYNHCAVTAGEVCGSDQRNDGKNNKYSICPKGWRIPTGGNSGEYQTLINAYNGDMTRIRNALHVVFDSTITETGLESSLHWTSTVLPKYQGEHGESGYFTDYAWLGVTMTESYAVTSNELQYAPASNSMYGADNGGATFTTRCILDVDSSGISTMQQLGRLSSSARRSVADSMEEGYVYQLQDERDGEMYNVAKLADGEIWLLDNLRLDPSTLRVALSSDNTNMPAAGSFNLPSNTSVGFQSLTTPQINTVSKDEEESYGDGSGKIGVYYNYCAASVGTVCSSDNDSDARYDICPAGWRMPTGGDDGEYQTLINSYSTFEDAKNALHSPASGHYYDSSAIHQGSYGSFWSSTTDDDNHIYSLDVRPDSVYPDYNSDRDKGLSVRCVAKEQLQEKIYIQDVTTDTCPAIPTKVYDNRDGEMYIVQKLVDGRCWMLNNLRLDSATLKTPLTTENTNMSPYVSFSLPENTEAADFGSYTEPQINNNEKDSVTYLRDNNYGIHVASVPLHENDTVGVYYNYCAASAGTICDEHNTENAKYDICPKGWRLPTHDRDGDAGGGDEYADLVMNNFMSSENDGDDVVNFNEYFRASYYGTLNKDDELYGDYYYNQTYIMGFWSSTVVKELNPGWDPTLYMQAFYSDSQNAFFNNSAEERKKGLPIRCIANVDPEPEPISMQDVTSSTCPTEPTIAMDVRDGERYTIQKLEDGNCWMLDNLRLDPATLAEKGTTLSVDNTNLDSNTPFSLPQSVAAIDSYTDPQINTEYKDYDCSYYDYDDETHVNKVGVYYNYCATTAGTYCYSENSEVGSVEYDICPKGWRLPTGGESGEYNILYNLYNDDGTFLEALRLGESASMDYTGSAPINSYGVFWTSSIMNTREAYQMSHAGPGDVYTTSSTYRDSGQPIRCVLK